MSQDWNPSPEVFANAVGDETVLLHIKDGVYYGLDPVGSLIWAGLNEGRALPEICASIAGRFEVPLAQVEADARAFIVELEASNIVVAAD